MEKTKKGEKYWIIKIECCTNAESYYKLKGLSLDIKEVFGFDTDIESVVRKLRAVLNGAEIMEDWQKEKIDSWDAMLETKDEISKNYSKLLNNPKVQAVLEGADVIQTPSRAEIFDAAGKHVEACDEEGHPYSDKYDSKAAFVNGAEWLKSKIIK